MGYIVYVLIYLAQLLLLGLRIAMLLRAILSWLPVAEDGFLVSLLYSVTEPIIMPLRALFFKMGWFQDFPLDMPFMIAFLLLSLLGMFF